jgi:hypothetical protein
MEPDAVRLARDEKWEDAVDEETRRLYGDTVGGTTR